MPLHQQHRVLSEGHCLACPCYSLGWVLHCWAELGLFFGAGRLGLGPPTSSASMASSGAQELAQSFLFLFLFFFCHFRAAPTAYGGSQAKGLIGRPTPQLMAVPDRLPAERGQGSNRILTPSSHTHSPCAPAGAPCPVCLFCSTPLGERPAVSCHLYSLSLSNS